MFRSSGIIRYDPRSKSVPRPGHWWLILECDKELARYYREMVNRFNIARFKLMDSAWSSHISVVRGTAPENKKIWGFREGQEVEFSYSGDIENNRFYWWLPVECPELEAMRVELKVAETMKLHLTIGVKTSP